MSGMRISRPVRSGRKAALGQANGALNETEGHGRHTRQHAPPLTPLLDGRLVLLCNRLYLIRRTFCISA